MESDGELYRKFLSGDTTSYDQLMIRYGDSLTFFLNGYLHDWHDAEDLMIEAFARIMVKRPRMAEGAFKAYLFKTARNLAARFHSKKSRMKAFSIEEMQIEIAGAEEIEQKLQDKEMKEVLHLCLSKIDPQVREALWLVYFEDMKYAEAGAVMGVNAKRVDHLLTRGKKQLRSEMEKGGIGSAY